MNRTSFAAKTLIASLGLFAAFASQASDEVDYYREGGPQIVWNSPDSGVTRMDVLAELARARKAGELDLRSFSRTQMAVGMPLTREQVKAELQEAIRIGALDHREHSTSPTAEQLELIRLAGQRAITMKVAAR